MKGAGHNNIDTEYEDELIEALTKCVWKLF